MCKNDHLAFSIAHQGNYSNGPVIDLLNNLELMITRFEADVFKSVLEKIASFGGYPNAYVQIENS